MIDWGRIDTLRDEVGEDALDEVIDLFLEEVDQVIARLESNPIPAEFDKDLHFLKGSALNLGFTDFGTICQDGERKAASGAAESIDIVEVITLYRRSRRFFLEHMRCAMRATG